LAAAVLAATDAKAGLLSSSFDAATPAVSTAFGDFASLEQSLFGPRDHRTTYDAYGELPGAAEPATSPAQKLSRQAKQIAVMNALASPGDAAGAGALSPTGHGPSSQMVGFSPAYQLPTPQLAMRLYVLDGLNLPPSPTLDLFHPPRLAV
jgi:hypothetical protein